MAHILQQSSFRKSLRGRRRQVMMERYSKDWLVILLLFILLVIILQYL
ncbi:hypothetical protein [Fontibacillus sp. BL9]